MDRRKLMAICCLAAAIVFLVSLPDILRFSGFGLSDRIFILLAVIESMMIFFMLSAAMANFFFKAPGLILLPLLFSVVQRIAVVAQRVITEGVGYWLIRQALSAGMQIILQLAVLTVFFVACILLEIRRGAAITAMGILTALFFVEVAAAMHSYRLLNFLVESTLELRILRLHTGNALRGLARIGAGYAYYTVFAYYTGFIYKGAYARSEAPR